MTVYVFPTNKYTTWYRTLVEHARARLAPDSYSERHHVVPRSLGGVESPENIVRLTAREHFVCHRLLTVVFPKGSIERRKMSFALHKMAYGTNSAKYKITSRQYDRIRELNAAANSERQTERFTDPVERAKQAAYALAASRVAAERNKDDPNFGVKMSEINKARVEAGTHNFLGGEIQRNMWQDPNFIEKQHKIMDSRLSKREHLFQQSEFIENQRERIKNRWLNMSIEDRALVGKAISGARKRNAVRVEIRCCVCDLAFLVTPCQAKFRKCCSLKCAGSLSQTKRRGSI